MYLHNDKELFGDIVALTAEKMGQAQDIIEKDYYVTIILKELSSCDYPICFKGGTSLSKAFGVIDRFSEDIDITFTEHLGKSRRKNLKYDILKSIADKLGFTILASVIDSYKQLYGCTNKPKANHSTFSIKKPYDCIYIKNKCQ